MLFVDAVVTALSLVVEKCPRLTSACYWAGTACIALEELGHRTSFDLDFHTRRALVDVRPLLTELHLAFREALTLAQSPDEFGSGFQAVLSLPGSVRVTIEVLSNFDDVSPTDIQAARSVVGIDRVTLSRYLADKVQCVAERVEAKDLFDINAVLMRHPEMEPLARKCVADSDAILMSERLLKWTDESLARDLRGYPDVDPREAVAARDRLLWWLRS